MIILYFMINDFLAKMQPFLLKDRKKLGKLNKNKALKWN